jgi:hypothetical protein
MNFLELPSDLAPGDLVAAINDRMRRLAAAQPTAAAATPAKAAAPTTTSVVSTTTVYGVGVALYVGGALGIAADAAPAMYLPSARTPTAAQAYVKTAPTGAALAFTIYAGGVAWLALTIADGATYAAASPAAVAAAGSIAGGCDIRIAITAVGTTFPGADLAVFLYF